MPYFDRSPDAEYKDWNEQLVGYKRSEMPIQRLMKRGREGAHHQSLWTGMNKIST